MNEYVYSQIEVGTEESFTVTITENMEKLFREITGDINPLHIDDEFAKQISHGKYEKHVSFGMLTASLYSTLAGVYLPGKYSLIHSFTDLKFLNPVFINDNLTISGNVVEKNDALKLIIIKANIKNQSGKTVSKAKIQIIVMK